ncbi:MAG: pyroglutamyl-peptidase I [Planctomycetes bacterium]|nr:pyroglutamyl-peptidase I [Planctomycetota bacterium]
MTKKLLLTGFEPFGDWQSNPSFDALKFAADAGLFDAPDLAVEIAEIPVDYNRVFDTVERLVESVKPAAIVHFGLHSGLARGRDVIYIETTARNRNGASKPDNAGIQRDAGVILANEPATIATTLPASALCNALSRAGFSVETSDDAGGYLCNFLFFRTLSAFGEQFPCGFIHVPLVDTLGGVITLERMAHAMATVARVLAFD